jgi:hypothetical protein
MICCENTESLGCLNSCAPLNLGVATIDGTYTLLLEYNEAISNYQVEFVVGNDLIFEVPLNESYFYTAKLIAPDDSFVCFEFKTKIYISND